MEEQAEWMPHVAGSSPVASVRSREGADSQVEGIPVQIQRITVGCCVCQRPVGVIVPQGMTIEDHFGWELVPLCEPCGQACSSHYMSPRRLRALPTHELERFRGIAKEPLAETRANYW